MTNPDFRTAIRNQALTVKGETLAGHIQKSSSAALKKELSELMKTGNVRSTAAQLSPQRSPPPKQGQAQATGPESLGPDALAEVFSQACEAAMDAIYQGIQVWAATTMVNGATTVGPTCIAPPGCVKPGQCGGLEGFLMGSLPPDMPEWARDFAKGLVRGFGDSVSHWVASISFSGMPLFPAMQPGPNVPLPLSGAQQAMNFISEDMIAMNMKFAGARVDRLPNAGTATSMRKTVDAAAREYVARVVSGMLKFSIVISMVENLQRLPSPPNVPVAQVVSGAGVLGSLGRSLPHPSKWSVNGFPTGGLDTALREDLTQAAFRAAFDTTPPPAAPPPPPG